jgi:hypothetical protein
MKAQLPATYMAARQALAKCVKLDECRTWAAKAAALKSYAKQMKDSKLEDDAQRIRNRAVQRAGELIGEIEASKGGQPTHKSTQSPKGQSRRAQAAVDAGLTPKQAKTAVEVARVEKQIADEMIEASPPAAVSQLAAAGRKTRPKAEPEPFGDEWWEWTIAVRRVAALPACGLKVLAARTPLDVPDLIAECRTALDNLTMWQRQLEDAHVMEAEPEQSAREIVVSVSAGASRLR